MKYHTAEDGRRQEAADTACDIIRVVLMSGLIAVCFGPSFLAACGADYNGEALPLAAITAALIFPTGILMDKVAG